MHIFSNIFSIHFLSFLWSIYFGSLSGPVMSQMTDSPSPTSSLLPFSLIASGPSPDHRPPPPHFFPCFFSFLYKTSFFHSLAFPNPYHAKSLRFEKKKENFLSTKTTHAIIDADGPTRNQTPPSPRNVGGGERERERENHDRATGISFLPYPIQQGLPSVHNTAFSPKQDQEVAGTRDRAEMAGCGVYIGPLQPFGLPLTNRTANRAPRLCSTW